MKKRLAILALLLAGSLAPTAVATTTTTMVWWQNCTAVHHLYPHGVGRRYAHDITTGTPVTNFKRSTYLYNLAISHNAGLDRDHDHIACEKH